MSGQQLITVQDYEEAALKKLSKMTGDYYRSGANDQVTLEDNRKAFLNYKIRPFFLRKDVTARDTRTSFLGTPVSSPIGVAPTAMQRMAHPEGELATAKACEAIGTLMILSTISTSSIEEVAAAAPNANKWFQLYIYKDRNVTRSLVKRAEAAGFKGLALTVDTPYFGTRLADSRNNFCLPSHLSLANFKREGVKEMSSSSDSSASGLNEYANELFDASLTWKDVNWLTKITSLPVIAKGVLTGEDAVEAVKHGASGIIVSNHGARQLDHVPATMDVLPEIIQAVKRVNPQVQVFVDGGFRTGTDVLKALALGARGVFVGRPVLWGLAVDGQKGVERVLGILKKEFNLSLGLTGLTTVDEVREAERSLVVRKDFFSKL